MLNSVLENETSLRDIKNGFTRLMGKAVFLFVTILLRALQLRDYSCFLVGMTNKGMVVFLKTDTT